MADEYNATGGNYETRAEALKGDSKGKRDAALVKMWLDAIDLASKEEAGWRESASKVVDIFKDAHQRTERRFNILYSNIETIVPAVYSSLPTPDVRRRYNDKDPAGMLVSQMLERALSYSIDAYDFDTVIRNATIDCELVGRAVDRVRYVPYFAPGGYDKGEPDEGTETPEQESAEHVDQIDPTETGEVVANEEVVCERVNWTDFRRGPARVWADVPWIAFQLFLTREQLRSLSHELGDKVKLDCPVEGYETDKAEGAPPEIFMRARVWEIWDKETKKVLFIATGYKDGPLKVADDPLKLRGFFPIPRPLYAVTTPDCLTPIEPYKYYKDQAEELDRVTRRITKLIQVLKWRGFYPGSGEDAGVMSQLTDADDGELVPISNIQGWVGSGGGDISKAIWLMPIEQCAKVLESLYTQRDQIKQVIYEITGVADILRGSTDAGETATAQQIKSQWGSLRIQRRQAEVQRYVRDIFRLMSEIMAEHFSIETLERMTGIRLLTAEQKQMAMQAVQSGQPMTAEQKEIIDQPPREEVEQLLRSDLMRMYRIDVESDSTIRGDLTKYQQTMTEFLTGTAAFLQAVGPMVQEGVMPKALAVQLYIPYARQFRLGKATEDALEEFSVLAEQADKQPKTPSPEQMKLEADKQRGEMDAKLAQDKHQMEMQGMQADLAMKQQSAQMDMAIKEQDFAIKQKEMALKEQEIALKERELGIKAVASQQQFQMDQQRMAMESERSEREHALGLEAAETKHSLGLEMMAAKAKQAKQRPEARA